MDGEFMDMTDGYSISFPVFSAKEIEGGAFQMQGEVRGTAFALGANFMMTAGHVARDIDRSGPYCMVVALWNGTNFKSAKVTDVDFLAADIAILKVDFVFSESAKWFHRFRWHPEPLQPLQRVNAVGYAYGLHTIDGERKLVVVRGFHGYIVSGLGEFKPLGFDGSPFQVYELSFAVPRGLSGSPLLNTQGQVVVHGIVIGNNESRMTVFREEEHIEEKQETTIVERYEALTLGIAVTVPEILPLRSRLLGGPISDHLRAYNLL